MFGLKKYQKNGLDTGLELNYSRTRMRDKKHFGRTVKESRGSNLRNYELIKLIYDRCPDFRNNQYTLDQCFDRCLDIRDMIERERPEIKKAAIKEGV